MTSRKKDISLSLHSPNDLPVNKLILLYVLREVNAPVTSDQLTVLTIDRGWMLYFDMVQHLADMTEAGLMVSDTVAGQLRHTITPDGKTLLATLENRIPASIRQEIRQYVADNLSRLTGGGCIHAEVTACDGAVQALLRLTGDEGEEILRILLPAPDRDAAQAVCRQFVTSGPQLYAELVRRLTEKL